MRYISTSEKRTTSLQGTKWLVQKCPLLRGSTVYLIKFHATFLNAEMPTVNVFCSVIGLLMFRGYDFCLAIGSVDHFTIMYKA